IPSPLYKITSETTKDASKHPVDPLTAFDDASRRKCVFNVRNTQQGVVLGFSERSSDTVLSISSCAVLVPQISGSLDDLREICASLPQTKKPFRLSVLATQNGLDLSLEGSVPLNENTKTVLVRKALASGFARFSSDGEILIEPQKPVLKMGICEVAPPPGAFVQAVEAAETAMANLVCDHLSDCKSVADLFCGIGTFALSLAGKSIVWAVEENASALAALDQAWRETGGKLKQVKTETRNLDRRPASFQELKKIDGVVFDPPRAGAEAQARQIAKSKVRKVAAVSCNPVTLVRDLGILMDGGYRIHRITPIDQFKYTPHVEIVVLLER
ncbi:MAG: RNA methyltransferase, partial [Pseudomonadota bacterium]